METILGLLKVVIFVFISAALLLYVFQKSLIFYPQKIARQTRERYIPLEITMDTDGVLLHGWFVKKKALLQKPLIIYYGGNAEEVSVNIPDLEKIDAAAFLLMNYRGYGLSQGTPGESALLADALAVFDRIIEQEKIPPGQVVLMGRSLGSGVAVHVAHERPVGGVILVTPFDSLVNVAKKHYPFFPVAHLLKHRFDSFSLAPGIHAPMLALIASQDEIIPPAGSLNLVNNWAGPSKTVTIEGSGHNDISFHNRYWQSINHFLSGHDK